MMAMHGRIAGFLSIALFFASPTAHAQQTLDSVCAGHTGNPSGVSYFDQEGNAAVMDAFLKQKVLCPSACYDVNLELGVESKKLKISISATNKCSSPQPDQSKIKSVFSPLEKPNEARNCSGGKGLPSVTATTRPINSFMAMMGKNLGYTIPNVLTKAQTVGPKSRCDQNVSSVISSFTQNGNNGLDVGFQGLSTLENPKPIEIAPPPSSSTTFNLGTVAGTQQLEKALTDAGIEPEKAQELAKRSGPTAAQYIDAIASGDQARVDAAAKAIGVTPVVLGEDVKLADSKPPESITQPPQNMPAQQNDNQQGATGFTNEDKQQQTPPELPTQCGVDGLAGNIMRAESQCGRINSNPLSSVQGPYHFLCSTWQQYANSTGNGAYSDCGYRNDPAISTQVMNARMAQFGEQYGSSCAQAGLSQTSCQYAIHVFGEGGFRRMLSAAVSDPSASAFSLCGSALSSAACSNNSSIFSRGGTVAGVFSELDRRLGGNGTIIPNVAAQSGSPFGFTGAQTGGGYTYPVSYTGYAGAQGMYAFSSPFSNVNPLYSPYAASYGASGWSSLGMLFGQLIGSSQQQPYPSFGGTAQPNTQMPVINPGASLSPQPNAILLAQPLHALKGETIMISWSSAGFASGTCSVMMRTSQGEGIVAQGTEGTRSVSAEMAGDLTISLRCIAADGTVVSRDTSVQIR